MLQATGRFPRPVPPGARALPASPFFAQSSTVFRRRGCCARQPRQPAVVLASAAPSNAREEEATKGSCYGCGIPLQTRSPQQAGYVQPERYRTKLVHRQLDQLLCRRCQDLSNGAMIPAVADFAQIAGNGMGQAAAATGFEGKRLLTPEQLRASLKVVRGARALVVLLVDLLDASGSLLGRVRDFVGNNPIVLVGTKADLLPEGTRERDVAEWLQAAAAFKKINAVSVHLVSARTGAGVSDAVAAIRQERRGRDVYVIGAANVGKSAFIRALVKDMASATSRQYDPQASSRAKYLPVESAMPGTTLQLIPMEVFAAGGLLYDTPGLHLHHRIPHILTPDENKALHPRRRLRPYAAPSLGDLLPGVASPTAAGAAAGGRGSAAAGRQQAGAAGGPGGRPLASYWWGGLVRIDVVQGPPSLQLVFYGPPALRVVAAAAGGAQADDTQPAAAAAAQMEGDGTGGQEQPGQDGPFGAESVQLRGGLRMVKRVSLRTGSDWRPRPLGDVAVSGVPGWVSVLAAGGAGQRVELEVWAPVGVEGFSRPPLPAPLL